LVALSKPGGEIHAITQHGELHALRMSDGADNDLAVVHADADGQF